MSSPEKAQFPDAPPPYSAAAPPYPGGPPPPPGAYPPGPGYSPGPPYPGAYPPSAPPPQGYPVSPQTTQPPSTVVYSVNALGPGPSRMVCPYCQQEIVTNVTYESGLLTWILVFLICLFGGPLCCCLIPLCCPPCKDVEHSCPQCGRSLGTVTRI